MFFSFCLEKERKGSETKKGTKEEDFKDSCFGPGGPDWVILIFADPNTSLKAIGSDRRFGQTALPSSG